MAYSSQSRLLTVLKRMTEGEKCAVQESARTASQRRCEGVVRLLHARVQGEGAPGVTAVNG
jgi:hypothetical protein